MASPYRPFGGGAEAAAIRARGTTAGRQRFGRISMRIPTSDDTFQRSGLNTRVATPKQLADRIADGYTGQGKYGRMRMRGRGGFWGDLYAGTAGLRSSIGRSLRSGGAGAWGSAAGHAMQALGVGDYVTNSLVNGGGGQSGGGVPSFSPGQEGSIVVTHEEYLSDVFGPAANEFVNKPYQINPGLEETFPWLAQIAQNYDEYTIHQLMFSYRSSIAPIGASGTGQVGTVIMATQYNSDEPPFNSKGQMLQYAASRSARVIDGMIQGVECNPNMSSGAPGKYVRAGPTGLNQDIKTYDLGVFNMAVSDVPATYTGQSIGELYVSYTVELRKPKFFEAAGLGISRDYFLWPVGPGGVPNYDYQQPTNVGAGITGRLSGQQNRIGCTTTVLPGTNPITQLPLPSPTQVMLPLGLPDAFYGMLKVVATVTFNVVGLLPTVAGAQLAVPPVTMATTGNVHLISDIIRQGTPGAVGAGLFVPSWDNHEIQWAVDGANVLARVEFHIRVDVAGGAIPNTVAAYINFVPVGGPNWTQVTYDVSEYNTAFNYKDDGTNDQIVLVGATGGVVAVP